MFPRYNMQLNYSKIFSNTFKYNDEESQKQLLQYAKSQLARIDDKKFESVMKKTDKCVFTLETSFGKYSPSKAGDYFKNYIAKNVDPESREDIDNCHVLIVDYIYNSQNVHQNIAYPIRWSPNNKVKAGGSWVLGCGKVSPKGSDQEMSSPEQPLSGKKQKTPPSPEAEPAPKRVSLPKTHAWVSLKQKTPAVAEEPAVAEAPALIVVPTKPKTSPVDKSSPVIDLCKSQVSEGQLSYERLIKEWAEEKAYICLYEEPCLNGVIKASNLSDQRIVKDFIQGTGDYWYLRNILVKCEVDQGENIRKLRKKIKMVLPISVDRWLEEYDNWKEKYSRPSDDLSESDDSDSESDTDSDSESECD